jgi:predicted transcriptional regulator
MQRRARTESRSQSIATQDELLAMAHKVGASERDVVALQSQAMEVRADRDAWRRQAVRRLASIERRPWTRSRLFATIDAGLAPTADGSLVI